MSLTGLRVSDIPVKTNLIKLSHHDQLDTAFSKLFDNRILSAPVLDDEGKVKGLLAMIDIAVFAVNLAKTSQALVSMLGMPISHPEALSNFDNLPDLFIGDKRLEDAFGSDPTDFMKNFSRRNPTRTVSYAGSWQDLAEALSQVRRVVVLNAQGHLLNYITQSDFIKLLNERNLFGDKWNKTISELSLGTSPVISVRDNKRAIDAFKEFALHDIEAVPIVDASGKIVGNVSATDIRVMEASADAIDALYLKYDDFRKKMETYNIPSAPVTVTSKTTLGDVVSLLVKNKIHRVYVVDNGALKSVVSMMDIIRTVANHFVLPNH